MVRTSFLRSSSSLRSLRSPSPASPSPVTKEDIVSACAEVQALDAQVSRKLSRARTWKQRADQDQGSSGPELTTDGMPETEPLESLVMQKLDRARSSKFTELSPDYPQRPEDRKQQVGRQESFGKRVANNLSRVRGRQDSQRRAASAKWWA